MGPAMVFFRVRPVDTPVIARDRFIVRGSKARASPNGRPLIAAQRHEVDGETDIPALVALGCEHGIHACKQLPAPDSPIQADTVDCLRGVWFIVPLKWH